jgi:antitoxin component YwqK of YwqJK toxin-antitoxin module
MKKTLLLVALIAVGCGPEGPPPDGPFETYHENGQLEEKGTYKDGELDGPSESYYENGEVFIKGSWKDGKKCGEWIEFGETVTYDPCPPNLE